MHIKCINAKCNKPKCVKCCGHCLTKRQQTIKSNIQIITPPTASKRTIELQMPLVRKLIEVKKEFNDIQVDKEKWKNRFDTLIRDSVFTRYSRLAGVLLPAPIKKKRWSQKDKERFDVWMEKNAGPKPIPKFHCYAPEELERPKMTRSELAFRVEVLSEPRWYYVKPKVRPIVTKAAMKYEPTPRICEMAVQHERLKYEKPESLPYPVSDDAKKYKASARIKELSTARKKPEDEPLKEFAFTVNPLALKMKASARTKELAEPKPKEESAANNFAVSPNALKAKASDRTIELAKPRKRE